MSDKMEIKEENLVKKTCRELGITQKELAEKIGFSANTVSKWSRGLQLSQTAKNFMKTLLELQNLKLEYENFRKKVLLENTNKI